jgi:hypothetical protein
MMVVTSFTTPGAVVEGLHSGPNTVTAQGEPERNGVGGEPSSGEPEMRTHTEGQSHSQWHEQWHEQSGEQEEGKNTQLTRKYRLLLTLVTITMCVNFGGMFAIGGAPIIIILSLLSLVGLLAGYFWERHL